MKYKVHFDIYAYRMLFPSKPIANCGNKKAKLFTGDYDEVTCAVCKKVIRGKK
jgi:hypothetical protein